MFEYNSNTPMSRPRYIMLLICFILSFQNKAQPSLDRNNSSFVFHSSYANLFACNLNVNAGNDTLICENDFPIQLNGSFSGNAINYYWSPGTALNDSTILNPTINSIGTYTLTVESIDDVNLVVNGDFENGDIGFTTDYSTGAADVGNYLISDTPQDYFHLFSDCADHTTGSGNMMIVDGADIPDQNMWCQTINLNPNTNYYFSVWSTMVGGTSPPELFFTANGTVISDTMSIPFDNCLWTELSSFWNSGINTSIEFCIVNDNISPFGNDFAIDDIFVAPVCEVIDEVEVSVLDVEAVSSNSTINCIGDCITLDGSGSTVDMGVSYGWTSITGGNIQNSTTLNPTVCDTGIYQLKVARLDTNSGLICYDSILVEVDLALENTITPSFVGLDNLCNGDTFTYQINSIDPNVESYDWIVTNGQIVDGQDSSSVLVEWNNLPSGEICVSAINNCHISDTTCMAIVINSSPDLPVISGLTNVCSSIITNYSTTSSLNINNYEWTVPLGTTIQSGQGTEMIELDWGVAQGGDICLLVENGCGADSSCLTVTFGNIGIVIDSLNPLCFNDNNGWIKITPLGGVPPFTFNWNNGEIGDSIGALAAGDYIVTVSDSNGCSTIEQVSLQNPEELTFNFGSENISCHGACDGMIWVEMGGGVAPYDYLWDNNLGTNDSLLNLCPGNYNITVTDANGCTVEGQTQLSDPPLIEGNILMNDTTICSGDSIDLLLQLSGIGPFDLELNNGILYSDINNGDTISISPVNSSSIFVANLIDQGQPNCQGLYGDSIFVTVNSIPNFPIITGLDTLCQGTNETYCISNFNNQDSIIWSIPQGGSILNQNANCVEIGWGSFPGGQICAEIINDCGSVQSCMDVVLNSIPVSSFSVDPLICIDSISTFSFTGIAGSNANYIWDFDGGIITSGNNEGPFEIAWPSAGLYNILLTVEENDCSSAPFSTSVTVENPIPAPVINCSSTTNSITFTWDDVNGATNYQVNDLSGNGGMVFGNMYMVSGLSNGEEVTIEVTAFGNNTCGATTVQASCSADDCPNIQVLIDHVDPICLNANTPLVDLFALVSGGTGQGSMVWNGTGIINSTDGIFDPNLAGVGVHDITLGYEENNCLYFDVVTIEIFETPEAVFEVDDVICLNENSTITYTGSTNLNASFNWNFAGGNIISGSGAGPFEIEWANSGNYEVTLIVEENGCQSEFFSQIVQVDNELSSPNITCQSTTQSIIFSWDDIPGAFGYVVNEISGLNGVQNGNTITYNNLTPGQEVSIEVIAFGNSVCGNSSNTFTCFANDCPNIDLQLEPVNDICLDHTSDSIPLEVSILGSDGTGVGNWSGVGVVDNTFYPNIAGSGTHEIIYEFSELQCNFSSSIFINIYDQPNADLYASEELDCSTTSIIIDGSNSIVFGDFTWTTNTGNIFFGENTLTPEVDAPGTYYLTINNAICSSIDSIVISENNILPIADAGNTQELTCSQECVTLGGINTSIGDSYIYSWSNQNGFVSNEINPEVCQSGQYNLTVIDTVNNCVAINSSVIVLNNNNLPFINIESFGSLDCNTTSIVLDASNSTSGTQIEYQWMNENGLLSGETNNSLEISTSGLYYLELFNLETGCSIIDSIFVDENTVDPIAEILIPEILTCSNQQVILDGSNSSSSSAMIYEWNSNTGGLLSGGNSNQAIVTEPGFYQLIVTDTLNGCETSASIQVLQNIVPPNVDTGPNIELACNENQATIGSNNTSTGSNFSYLWTSSNPDAWIESPTSLFTLVEGLGEYNLLVTNSENGCTDAANVIIDLSDNIPTNINMEVIESPCYGDNQGSIEILSIDGGVEPYLYSFDNNPFSSVNSFNSLPTGSYDITVQDINGCELSTTVILNQPDSVSLYLGGDIYIELGDSITLSPVIGGNFDTIEWSFASSFSNCDQLDICLNPTLTPLETTNIAASISNNDGCSATDQITIFVNKKRNIFIPNAFSPEGSADNQIFMVYAGKGVEKVNNLKIFSRWGEPLYEASNFFPNDNNYGWDGSFNGEKMIPGVYIYFAEIEFTDGVIIQYKGDVTLMR